MADGNEQSQGWGAWIASGVSGAVTAVLGEDEEAPEWGAGDGEAPPADMEVKQLAEGDGDEGRDAEKRKGGYALLKAYIGLDITGVTLPVWLFEPMSILMRAGEPMEYADLIFQASQCGDPVMKEAMVASFCVMLTGVGNERTWKPFNPILGETFQIEETTKGGNDIQVLCEQVSHHPPISAVIYRGEGWEYGLVSGITTKYWGNSVEVFPEGNRYIKFDSGDYYTWTVPQGCLYNCLVGRMWLDFYGDSKLTNHTTGWTTDLKYTQCGYFSAGRWEVNGQVNDETGASRATLGGHWNAGMSVTVAGSNEAAQLWTMNENAYPADDPFKMSAYARHLGEPCEGVLPTDARLRPDRMALAAGDLETATTAKLALENKQRADRKDREEKGVEWQPVYFEKRKADDVNGEMWMYKGNFFEAKK